MPDTWKFVKKSPGIFEVKLKSWDDFPIFIAKEFLDFRVYVYRGQRKASWRLQSTLSRELKGLKNLEPRKINHLGRFIQATRGRRGINPPNMPTDNDWWALGQHFNLATPLLDWSISPYVSAFFAFAESETDDEDHRAIYAISKDLERENGKILKSTTKRPGTIEFISPHSNENGRLVSQGGLFTASPLGVDLEDWVKDWVDIHCSTTTEMFLIKILIPNKDRESCLRNLNRMNINYLSLFPDLEGASKHSNMELSIKNY